MNTEYKPSHFEIDNKVYSFQQIKKEDLNRLTDFFNTARERKLEYDFFQKKYDTRWTGKENIAIVIKDEESNIVGHLGVLPVNIVLGDKIYFAGQISDAVLDPSLRGRNVFENLINETAELAKAEGLAFLFVLPSPQAVKAFEVTNWQSINQLLFYEIPLKTIPLNKAANKFGLTSLYHFYIRTILGLFSRKSEKLVNPNFKIGKGGIEISEGYIKQKNYTRNYLRSRKGFTFWIKVEDGIEIGNVAFFEENKQSEFLKEIRFLSKLIGTHQIKISTSIGTFQDELMRDFNKTISNKIYFMPLNEHVPFEEILINGSDLNTF